MSSIGAQCCRIGFGRPETTMNEENLSPREYWSMKTIEICNSIMFTLTFIPTDCVESSGGHLNDESSPKLQYKLSLYDEFI